MDKSSKEMLLIRPVGLQKPIILFWKYNCQVYFLKLKFIFKNLNYKIETHIFSVYLLSHVQLFATPWIVACQAFLSITNSQSLLKLMSTELMMPQFSLVPA